MSLPNFDLAHSRVEGSSSNDNDAPTSTSSTPAAAPPRQRRRSSRAASSTWRLQLGLHPHTSRSSIFALFLHATCSVLFLVFLNSAQAFLLPLLAAAERDAEGGGKGGGDREGLRVGALSGKLQLADEILSVFLVLVWGSLADRSGFSSSPTSSSRRIHPPSQARPRTRRPGRWSLLPRGVPLVTSLGYLLVSAGLACYALAEKPWPHLLWARLVFASGASAVTAMLTGALATWAAPVGVGVEGGEAREGAEGEATAATPGEETPLLASRPSSRPSKPARHGRLSALAGLLTGIGAVVAVLVLLPLPVWLAGAASHAKDDARLLRATRQAFLIVAALAFCVAVAVVLGLREPGEEGECTTQRSRRNDGHTGRADQEEAEVQPPQPPTDARAARRARLRSRITPTTTTSSTSFAPLITLRSHALSLLRGFTLARTHPTLLPLAYLGGALARSLTLASTLFLPLYVAHYFYETRPDVCLPPPEDGTGTGGPLKETCRQAYMLASAQSGILQTMCLIAAPLAGWACDALGPLGVLLASSVAAGFGFLGYANGGEPTLAVAWLSAAMVGLAQGGAIVSSLVLVARGKGVVEAGEKQGENEGDNGEEEEQTSRPPRSRSAGAISGAYSSCGALCIIIVSSIGGWLFDMRPQAPFFLLAGIGGLVAVATMLGMLAASRRKAQRRQDDNDDDM